MTIQETIQKVRSGVCKIEFYVNGNLVNSGSGFVHKNKLITNSHVFHPEGFIFPDNTPLVLVFGNGKKIELAIRELVLLVGSDEANADFAIYEIPNQTEILNSLFNFELSNLEEVSEGDEVVLLGFPFDTTYLTTHHGRVSALFKEDGIKKIQIDASVNQGNSGGPLYHLKTGKVIGIITRKQSGLNKDFDDLLQNFSNNIIMLRNLGQNVTAQIGGIDLLRFFEISQSQMQLISRNIKRSANTGIGYAFSCEKLLETTF